MQNVLNWNRLCGIEDKQQPWIVGANTTGVAELYISFAMSFIRVRENFCCERKITEARATCERMLSLQFST